MNIKERERMKRHEKEIYINKDDFKFSLLTSSCCCFIAVVKSYRRTKSWCRRSVSLLYL